MFTRTVSIDDLSRLKREREEADRRYNEALTALDVALPRAPEMPHPPPALDEHQVTPINQFWNVLAAEPPGRGRGLRARLARFVWGIVSPPLERQVTFNAALVDHVNRNLEGQREARKAVASVIAVLRDQLVALGAFESRLVQLLQEITPYVDTKDREAMGLARRITEDTGQQLDLLDHRLVDMQGGIRGLGAGLSGVSDELLRRWESMVAREQRYDARVSALGTAHNELRVSLGVVQQATLAMKRELERLAEVAGNGGAARGEAAARRAAAPSASEAAVGAGHALDLDSYKYVAFEDLFRGSQEEIRTRVAEYLPLFEGGADVLDVGCGRGEFLDLLREAGIEARGLDVNRAMVEVCRERGLNVAEGDALGYVRALRDGSLGGLFAAQVVEHLEPAYLVQLLEASFHKLRPGARIVLETINPACWFAFFESYLRDLTHVRPLHPDTLKYLLVASGFQNVDIRYRAPYPEHEKLRPLRGEGDLVETFNANAEKINRLLFTHLDYAAVAERPRA